MLCNTTHEPMDRALQSMLIDAPERRRVRADNVAMPYIDDAAKAWQLELAKRVGAAVKARRTALKK